MAAATGQVRTMRTMQTGNHDARHEAVHHSPRHLDLWRELLPQALPQGPLERLEQDPPVLLRDPIPGTKLFDQRHQLFEVVQGLDGVAESAHDLGEEPPERNRLEVALARGVVPLAKLLQDLRREDVDRRGRQLGDVPTELLAEQDVLRLQALPTALDSGLHAVVQRPGEWRAGTARCWRRWRCPRHRRTPRHTGARLPRSCAGRIPALRRDLAVAQAPLQLLCVTGRNAQILHVGVFDLCQRLHVVKAILQKDLGILGEASFPQKDRDRVILLTSLHIAAPIQAPQLLQFPPELHHGARWHPHIPHVCILHVH
mmetsp:Transcript_37915/g.105503  ORF Transcript_37915/g.105503 Transcript_37915/m.105503 type:complete len:314 (+) Transcript_37915:420-1361(+)